MNKRCKNLKIYEHSFGGGYFYGGYSTVTHVCEKQPDESELYGYKSCPMGSFEGQKCCKGYEEEDLETRVERELERLNKINEIKGYVDAGLLSLKKEIEKTDKFNKKSSIDKISAAKSNYFLLGVIVGILFTCGIAATGIFG